MIANELLAADENTAARARCLERAHLGEDGKSLLSDAEVEAGTLMNSRLARRFVMGAKEQTTAHKKLHTRLTKAAIGQYWEGKMPPVLALISSSVLDYASTRMATSACEYMNIIITCDPNN